MLVRCRSLERCGHVAISERLESRLLLATISWRPGRSGDFHNPANWSTSTVPGVDDDAVIGDVGAQTITLTQPASVRSVLFDNRTGVARLNASAPLTIATESRIGGTEQRPLGLNSVFSTTSRIDGAGLLRVNRFGELVLTDATVDVPLHVASRLVVHGTTSINGGLANASFNADAPIRLVSGVSAPVHLTIAGDFRNQGFLYFEGPASDAATLTVVGGQLVNERSIFVGGETGSGLHPRVIDAEVINTGLISVTSRIPLVLRRDSADHVNRGRITVYDQFVVDQTGESPSFTNAAGGRIEVGTAGGFSHARFTVRNGAYQSDGGAVTYGGTSTWRTWVLDHVTVNMLANGSPGVETHVNDSTIAGAAKFVVGATLTLNNSTVSAPLENVGTIIAHGNNAITGSFWQTIPQSAFQRGTLKIHADAATFGESVLTIAQDFHNAGTIEFRHDDEFAARLNVGGDFVSTGTIDMSSKSTIASAGDFTVDGGEMTFRFAGPTPGDESSRIISGAAVSLLGDPRLQLVTEPGFTPNDDFDVQAIAAATRTGKFGGTAVMGIGEDRVLRARYESDGVTIAVVPRVPEALDLAPESDTGVSTSDDVTRAGTLTFTGFAGSGLTVRLVLGDTIVAEGVATDRRFTITTDSLPEGEHVLFADAVDVDGDVARSNGLSITIDRTSPHGSFAAIQTPQMGGVGSLNVAFSERVHGFDTTDLSLTREAGANRLTTDQVLGTTDGVSFSIDKLPDVTLDAGAYDLAIAEPAAISDLAGNPLLPVPSLTWTNHLVSGTNLSDVIRIARDEADSQLVHVHTGGAASLTTVSTYSLRTSTIVVLHVSGGGQRDDVVIDFTYGAPGQGLFIDASDDGDADRVLIKNLVTDEPLMLKASAFTIGAFAIRHTDAVHVATATPTQVGKLSIEDGASLDIGNGTITIGAGGASQPTLEETFAAIASARNTGTARWTGPGLTSSAAAADPLTTLAVGLLGDDIVVKHTCNGDANLDGLINADDYFRIDQGFLAQPTSPAFAQGDFNYDGKINADDYFLIDQAFLGQATPLATASVSSRASRGLAIPNLTTDDGDADGVRKKRAPAGFRPASNVFAEPDARRRRRRT